jgi:hypothetical protein
MPLGCASHSGGGIELFHWFTQYVLYIIYVYIYNYIILYCIILYYIILYIIYYILYIRYYILYIIYYLLYIIYYILYMTGYGSHANSNGLPSFSLFKLLFVGIPYFQTHGSHYISMIGTVFVQCFSPGLKKIHWCWENSKKGSDSRTLRTFFTIRIPFSYGEQQSGYFSMFFQRGVHGNPQRWNLGSEFMVIMLSKNLEFDDCVINI